MVLDADGSGSGAAEQWRQQAADRWALGDRQGAIQILLDVINTAWQQGELPRQPCLILAYYFFLLPDFAAAEEMLSQLVTRDAQDVEALENRAVMRLRQRKVLAAVEDFQEVVRQRPQSINVYDGLANAYYLLGRRSEAKAAGEKALMLKAQGGAAPSVAIEWPADSPQAWDEQRGERDVVAFSLWGNNPRYLRGAMRNLQMVPQVYPGWQCRFYIDETVPAEFGEVVQAQGGEVVLESAADSLRQKLCWRFQVANDLGVRRFLVRDADAVVSGREAAAVAAWLASDRWFHIMRDCWTHTDLILGNCSS
jgi:tetratricopeptide (TPR) repeat protein